MMGYFGNKKSSGIQGKMAGGLHSLNKVDDGCVRPISSDVTDGALTVRTSVLYSTVHIMLTPNPSNGRRDGAPLKRAIGRRSNPTRV